MLLFGLTVFASAALMFLVEPMVARIVLPVAGGAPMVWNTCIVFFQAMLLAGYWYARMLASRTDGKRLAGHAAIIALPLVFLPFSIEGAPLPAANPVPWLFGALTAAVGLPFFVLATTTSLFQKWFADTRHRRSDNPYTLYAYSNLGSVLALLAYPIIVEPELTLREQERWWAIGYAIFAALAAAAMLVVWRNLDAPDTRQRPDAPAPGPAYAPSWSQRGRWTLLAFVPSSLMLGVTSYLTTDVASVPLLWVIPLALYLLTFVAAFSAWGDEARTHAAGLLPLVVLPLVVVLVARLVLPFYVSLALHLAVFGVLSLNCHGELAADRPPPAGLPDFYLWLAVGGVAGGVFNTLVAPALFSSIAEYPVAVALGCALYRSGRTWNGRRLSLRDLVFAAGVVLFTTAVLVSTVHLTRHPRILLSGLLVAAAAAFSQSQRPLRFALCAAGMLAAGSLMPPPDSDVLHRERTFFGVYRVETGPGGHHLLFHGTTLHGVQAVHADLRSEPLSYYSRSGPFGVAYSALPHLTKSSRIAVVGLGAGSLAAYARHGQHWTFYEIDPAVERIARTPAFFTYLADCGVRCSVSIGDARRSLAHAEGAAFDLIVLDAFSSDAIPLHLLSREALRIYAERLNPGGVLAFHVSNRHLTLAPVLARLARTEQLVALDWFDSIDPGTAASKASSEWMVMARSDEDLGALVHDARWTRPDAPSATPLWTDDFANIWSVLKR